MISYIQKLKEKCNINDELMNCICEMLDKLQEFAYISKYQRKKLEKRLYQNIDTIILGSKKSIDYKSGYYDASKKELYIKDIKNKEAVYLRLLYALTTKSSGEINYVGYSKNSMSQSDYKLEYSNFGINRAVCSGLICRILYTEPTTLSIVPSYRTYENDFLGRKIVADNDIYFIESKILNQICYIFDINIENLYSKLFYNPQKYLKTCFKKIKPEYINIILNDFDIISRKYANYNKLTYLNKCLNDNYKKIKIKILNSDIKSLEKEKERINLNIRNALLPLNQKFSNDDELDVNIESCLSETINELEEEILESLNEIQTIFVNYLLDSKKKYSSINFMIKLKTLQSISVLENTSLNQAIFDTITNNIMEKEDDPNIQETIPKIKYSLIDTLLKSNKYSGTYNDLKVSILNTNKVLKHSPLVTLSLNNEFVNLVHIKDTELPIKSLKNNVEFLNFSSMNSIINNHSTLPNLSEYEKIFTSLKQKFTNFENVDKKDVYFTTFENTTYIIIVLKNDFSILEVIHDAKGKINIKLITKQTDYFLFKNHKNTLPMLKVKPS